MNPSPLPLPDWECLQHQAPALAAELLPGLEPPRRGLPDLRRRLSAQGTALRNYGQNWLRHRQGREDLRPLYFIWTTLRSCNFDCSYCDDHRGRKYPDLPAQGRLDTEQGLALLEVMRTGTSSVYFAGGEPLLRKDLPLLCRRARDLDYAPIVINTNASIFHKVLRRPAWRTLLADVDILVVSLDALDLEVLADLWRTREPEDVLRNLLVLRELSGPMDFKLMVNTVIRPGHAGDAREVLELTRELDLWLCPVPANVFGRVHAGFAEDPEYLALVDAILDHKRAGGKVTGSLRLNERLLRGAPLTCRNTLKPHIDHDGRLAWPCKASMAVEPEWIDVLAHPDVDALYAAARALQEPAGFHGQGPGQCGADCRWAQNYTTDAYVHGLEHPLSLVREVVEFIGQA